MWGVLYACRHMEHPTRNLAAYEMIHGTSHRILKGIPAGVHVGLLLDVLRGVPWGLTTGNPHSMSHRTIILDCLGTSHGSSHGMSHGMSYHT